MFLFFCVYLLYCCRMTLLFFFLYEKKERWCSKTWNLRLPVSFALYFFLYTTFSSLFPFLLSVFYYFWNYSLCSSSDCCFHWLTIKLEKKITTKLLISTMPFSWESKDEHHCEKKLSIMNFSFYWKENLRWRGEFIFFPFHSSIIPFIVTRKETCEAKFFLFFYSLIFK